MYKAIHDYAREHHLVERKNRCMRQIAAYIVLDSDGEFQYVEGVDKKQRTKTECPDVGSFAFSGSSTSIICEKFCYIFCNIATDEEFGDNVRHGGWLEVMGEGAGYSEEIRVIYQFVLEIERNDMLRNKVYDEIKKCGVKDKDFISFRIGNIDVLKSESWEKWFDDYMERKNAKKNQTSKIEKVDVISALSGDIVSPIAGKENFPQLKVPQTGTGAYIASFSEDAFVSYGISDNRNTPMSQEEASAIKAGLEYLFTSEHNHSDDFSLLYWYTGEDVPDLVGRSLAKNAFRVVAEEKQGMENEKKARSKERKREMDYQEVLDSVFKGVEREHIESNGKYHLVQFTIPSKGRIFFTNEYIGSYRDLYENLKKWYQDSMMIYPHQMTHTLCYIYGILLGVMDHPNSTNKLEEIKNEFGNDIQQLLDSIFKKKQVPKKLYVHAIKKYQQSVLFGRYNGGNERDQPTRIPLQIIKTFLIREGYDMDVSLNPSSKSSAYQCGRWLAVMDHLQKSSASGKVGVTLGQKYYKATKRQPAKILTMVTDYKEIYLARLNNDRMRIYFEKLLGEISAKIGECFPDKFTIEEQGAFDMGYAQQHQAFYVKDDADNQNDEEEE